MAETAKIIKGNSFSDHRGILRFINDFHFDGIKRFYTITHPDTHIIRAWQGHKLETKCFYVLKGSFIINWIEIDNWEKPSKELKINKIVLKVEDNSLLRIPAGYANGIKALEPFSTLLVFSNLSLEESMGDNYRYGINYWNLI